MKVYCILEHRTGALLSPMLIQSDDTAKTCFRNIVNEQGNFINSDPLQYSLVVLCEIDMETGRTVDLERTSLGRGIDFLIRNSVDDKQEVLL